MRQFTKSEDAYQEAVDLMPGGVNSPVRAFKSVGMSPIFMESGQGSKITDVDGNEYIDYVLSWGDRKSTRLNFSHVAISYAVFCLKKKNNDIYAMDA